MKTRNPLLSCENVTHLAKFLKLNVLIQHQPSLLNRNHFLFPWGVEGSGSLQYLSRMTVEAWNNRALWECQASEMNSLTPNGDWLLTSPYRITLASNIKVMRIRKMITNLFYIFLMAKQTLLDSSMGKVKRSVRKIRNLFLRRKGVTRQILSTRMFITELDTVSLKIIIIIIIIIIIENYALFHLLNMFVSCNAVIIHFKTDENYLHLNL